MKYLIGFYNNINSFIKKHLTYIVVVLWFFVFFLKDFFLWKYIYLIVFTFVFVDKTHVLITTIKNRNDSNSFVQKISKTLFYFFISLSILLIIIYWLFYLGKPLK